MLLSCSGVLYFAATYPRVCLMKLYCLCVNAIKCHACSVSLHRTNADIEKADAHGNTPLIMAAMGGHPQIVDILLKAGANAKHQNQFGRSADDVAFKAGFDEVGHMLLDAGAKDD